MRILVFLKQIPAFDQIEFDARGLLNRAEHSREMNPFCRRAVAKATTLVEEHGGEIVFVTMGPPHAIEVLREAIAWADARSVAAHGLHLCDPEFAGSDLAATGQALSAAVATLEPWDLVLCGARSVDAGTAMIPALLAAIFGVRVIEWAESLELNDSEWTIRVEDSLEMERLRRTDRLVVSCAERICDPCKVGTDQASSVATERIRTMTAKDLGLAEPMTPAVRTRVVSISDREVMRKHVRLEGDPAIQVREAKRILASWSILPRPTGPDMVAPSGGVIVATDAAIPPEHAAEALTSQVQRESPIAILAPNTSWGREVAARLATKLGLGVITDVTSYSIEDRQVIATRPARSGLTTARIEALTSPVVLLARSQPFDSAELIVGIGRGLGHEHLAELTALARSANAALVASRKVTDAGWLPRSVQIGVTGTFVAPPVYLALGTSGRFNHSSGFRAAAYVLAANIDPNAEIFAHADIGMVGDAMELARAFLATENR